jgi:hypothetical protein
MRLAWLVKDYDDDAWKILFEEPDFARYAEIKMIAWVELTPGNIPA